MKTQPWWQALTLRTEIADARGNVNDVQTSLYDAVHAPERTPYADVGYYSDITHPTDGLLTLASRIALRLGGVGGAGLSKPVWRGDQGMGGGKSHAQVGLFHMANDPSAFFATDLGKAVQQQVVEIAGTPAPDDLGDPVVVVLPCDKMDPFRPDKQLDNIAESLGERWLWRLLAGDPDRLDRFHALKDTLGTPQGISAAMDVVGGRVLTLIDEVLNYIRKATVDPNNTARAQADQAFLRDLMDATNTSTTAALVIVMIASDEDTVAMAPFGESIRAEMEDLLTRFARSIATTSGADFAEIIRRRLFVDPPAEDVVAALVDTYADHASAGGWQTHFGQFTWWNEDFASKVARAYPFHPALVELLEDEWAGRAGFQKVRSTIQMFAATVHAWMRRAEAGEWAPPLIGLGDLVMSDHLVRDAVLDSGVVLDTKLVTNYREIAANDIVGTDDTRGTARAHDLERASSLFSMTNPRVAERLATAMFMCSLAPRTQGNTGATDAELRVAAFVPDAACQLGDVDAAALALEDSTRGIATLDIAPGKGGKPRRLTMSTVQTLQMFFRNQRSAVTDEEMNDALGDTARREAVAGPFESLIYVDASDHVTVGAKGPTLTGQLIEAIRHAGIDRPETRLVVLDPAHFTLLNGVDTECRTALSAALGLNEPQGWDGEPWPTPLQVAYPASMVFAVVNTQRRSHAKAAATDYLAWQRVAAIDAVAADQGLREQANDQIVKFKAALTENLRKAFQRLVYLGHDRSAATTRIEKDHMTALDGNVTWKLLVENERALDAGEFDVHALRHNLRDEDYGRTLSEIASAFHKTTRVPLLHGADADLRSALFGAVSAKEIELRNNGQVTMPTSPSDINLTSKSITVEKPAPKEAAPPPTPVAPPTGGPSAGATTSQPPPEQASDGEGGYGETPLAPVASEMKVALTLMGSAFTDPAQRAAVRQVFLALGDAVDEGDVSYGKFQVEIVVKADVADRIAPHLDGFGGNSSITPQ